jgi:ribA/ribD-fused uncharacterized protein
MNISKYTFFWQTGSPFSNWHSANYTIDGVEFCCSEQGVMYEKAILFNDDKIAKQILQCSGSQQKKMKQLGRKVRHFKESAWKKNRITIYTKHCKAKFEQNKHLKEKLLQTGNKMLVEASPYDKIWGIGLNEKVARRTNPKLWPGLNLLGQILTNIKEDFIKEDKK